ncbi:MAG TPA: DMT family transporter [Aggregatilineales bacterium]|nr:DMT family transporter [Aggregatilineales bacterium]
MITGKTQAIAKPGFWNGLSASLELDIRTFAALMLTIVTWASAFAAIRAGLEAYSPAHVALLRYLTASLVLAVYAASIRMPLPRLRDVPGVMFSGVIGIAIYNLALNTGEETVSAGVASFLIATAPVFVALLAMIFLKERLRAIGWMGIALSFCGAAVIALSKDDGFALESRAMLILVSAFAQGIFIITQKNYLQRYSPMQMMSYAIWSGTALLLIFAPGLPAAIDDAPLNATLAVVYMGVFPGVIGYLSYGYALKRIPANRGASFLYLVPLFAMLIAWLWLGEVPALISVFGGVLILAGVILVNVYGRVRNEEK